MSTLHTHQYAVLLAGGQGSRFWPRSRTLEPKQFLHFHKDKSLFEQTIFRMRPLINPENIFIVTSDLYKNQIYETASVYHVPTDNVILETEPRNTAPAVAIAAQLINVKDPQAKVCILPCDHLIQHNTDFLKLLRKAFNVCENKLIIFGILPHRPATGYGYIKITEVTKTEDFTKVIRFCEKPDEKTAKVFLKRGNYFWNSGIFVGSSRKFLEEFKTYLPDLYRQISKIYNVSDIPLVWSNIKGVSFDYGILEKSESVYMIKAKNIGWSDLGSWQSWDELIPKDKQRNKFFGEVVNVSSRNTTVLGNNRLIATIGLENLIIVDTPDALLVTTKDNSEEVKKVVDFLKKNHRQEHYCHKTVKRPWGRYTVLDTGNGFKIKLVEVKPKHALSLQFHKRRSEHWVVVEGKAHIIKNDKTYFVGCNESIYIPALSVHRIINPGDSILRIVEVQTGDYLEEDDIIRIKDDYNRIQS